MAPRGGARSEGRIMGRSARIGEWALAAAGLALAAVLAGRTCGGEGPPVPPNPDALKDVTIVIFGQPYTGTLIPPATEADFTFRVKASGEERGG